jgi:hypothetical protein
MANRPVAPTYVDAKRAERLVPLDRRASRSNDHQPRAAKPTDTLGCPPARPSPEGGAWPSAAFARHAGGRTFEDAALELAPVLGFWGFGAANAPNTPVKRPKPGRAASQLTGHRKNMQVRTGPGARRAPRAGARSDRRTSCWARTRQLCDCPALLPSATTP